MRTKVLIVGFPGQKATVLAGELIKSAKFDILFNKDDASLLAHKKEEVDIVIDLSQSFEIINNSKLYFKQQWPFIIETNGIDYESLKKEVRVKQGINCIIDEKISRGKAIYSLQNKLLNESILPEILKQYDDEIEDKDENWSKEKFRYHNLVKNQKTDYCFSWKENGIDDLVNGASDAIEFLVKRKFFTGRVFNMVDTILK
jgi:gamma-glutamyl phosphate reductase